MPVREGPPQSAAPPEARHETRNEPPPYPADKARGGEIVLRTRARRTIFIAGLAGLVLAVLLIQVLT